MRLRRDLAGISLLLTLSGGGAAADEEQVLAGIRQEALEHSQVMDHAFFLTDVYGPRFIVSPAFHRAVEWTEELLRQIGADRVWREGIGPVEEGGVRWSGLGWSYRRFAAHLLKPQYASLVAMPVVYSPPTAGRARGEAVRVDLPEPRSEELERFFSQHRGKLRNKILLTRPQRPIRMEQAAQFSRYTEEELEKLATVEPQSSPPAAPKPKPGGPAPPSFTEMKHNFNRLFQFLREEGVVAWVHPAAGEGGTIFVSSPMGMQDPESLPPPGIDLIPEQYNRLVRLTERGIPVTMEIELDSEIHPPKELVNLFAEIAGGEKKDELVLFGAHLDSWHGGTGATDNASGVAVVIEAFRILRKINPPMRRTVRAVFWGGHEIGTRGSRAYVRDHAVELANLSCYFNLDAGAGRIRGVYLQGQKQLHETLTGWLAPLKDLGAATVSLQSRMGSDQRSFHAVGVPALSFIQDRLHYESRTHHSTMDVYDYLPPEDLKQSAALLAALVYQAAQAPEKLRRSQEQQK